MSFCCSDLNQLSITIIHSIFSMMVMEVRLTSNQYNLIQTLFENITQHCVHATIN